MGLAVVDIRHKTLRICAAQCAASTPHTKRRCYLHHSPLFLSFTTVFVVHHCFCRSPLFFVVHHCFRHHFLPPHISLSPAPPSHPLTVSQGSWPPPCSLHHQYRVCSVCKTILHRSPSPQLPNTHTGHPRPQWTLLSSTPPCTAAGESSPLPFASRGATQWWRSLGRRGWLGQTFCALQGWCT